MEKVVSIIDKFCTFPLIEKRILFRLILFNFLVGNEDMHLKNFSMLIKDGKIALSPSYDLVNTTIALQSSKEEFALSLGGKKRNITRKLLVDYFANQRLGLNEKIIQKELDQILAIKPKWLNLVSHSFLSDDLKLSYQELLKDRFDRIC